MDDQSLIDLIKLHNSDKVAINREIQEMWNKDGF
jgi:hypothetical protein